MFKKDHPDYSNESMLRKRWRDAFNCDNTFIAANLQRVGYETENEYNVRARYAYAPTYAKLVIREICNLLASKMYGVQRIGSPEYTDVMIGNRGGVDLKSNSMNSFIINLLPQLLTEKKIGIFVDSPAINVITRANLNEKMHPYVYTVAADDILNWTVQNGRITSVLMKQHTYKYDKETGLPTALDDDTILMYETQGGVVVEKDNEKRLLGISTVPLVIPTLNHSLMEDVYRYQAALLNIANTDLARLAYMYSIYTEAMSPGSRTQFDLAAHKLAQESDNPEAIALLEKISGVGNSKDKKYLAGQERPDYISPSGTPIEISMKKQDQLKTEIRELIINTLSNTQSAAAGHETVRANKEGIESGLVAISSTLESAERQIAEIWADYINQTPGTVKYPITFDSRTSIEKVDEASKKLSVCHQITSVKAKKKIVEDVVGLLLEGKTNLMDVYDEIKKSECPSVLADQIDEQVDKGVISHELAAKLMGYPAGDAELANQEHAERLKRVQEAQMSSTEQKAQEMALAAVRKEKK